MTMNNESQIPDGSSSGDGGSTIENKSCFYTVFNPNGKHHRFVALTFMCWLGFGTYFCYDNPSALQDSIIDDFNITATQFSLLYSLYSWPSVIACVVGGVLIDNWFGIRWGTIIYLGIATIGQLTFAIGALSNAFWTMALGRFVLGIGAEPLGVAQSNYAVAWFKDKELNMVFGLQESCSSFGSVLNFWVMDPLKHWMSNFYSGYQLIAILLLTACIPCLFSLLCSLILGAIHKRAVESRTQNNSNASKAITLKSIVKFQWNFWLLVVVCVSYYGAIYPFFAFSKIFLMDKFGLTSTEANRLNSLLYVISVLGGPPLGFVIDKVGKNIVWLIAAVISTMAGHTLLAFFSWDPYIGVILISIASNTITIAFYPMVAMIIPENQLGTAYGVCWSMQNLFSGINAIVAGVIVDQVGYIWLEFYFISSLIVSLTAAVALLILNGKRNDTLNMTPLQRELHHQLSELGLEKNDRTIILTKCE